LVTQGKHFKAHRTVLLKHCTKLKYLLEDKKITQICSKENNLISRVHLKSSLHAVAYLLVHIYMPPLNIDEENIEDAADISYELGCIALALNCKHFIKKSTLKYNNEEFDFEKKCNNENDQELKSKIGNFIKFVNICEKLRFVKLYESLFKTLKNNFYKISKYIEQLKMLNPNSMRALIFDAELCIESELSLFYTIYNWLKFDENNRQCYLEEYFDAVCFEKIDLQNLIEIENQFSELFRNNKSINSLLYQAIKYHSMKNSKSRNCLQDRHNYNSFFNRAIDEKNIKCKNKPLGEERCVNDKISSDEILKEFKVAIILITCRKGFIISGNKSNEDLSLIMYFLFFNKII
jgi:hypothetical protein